MPALRSPNRPMSSACVVTRKPSRNLLDHGDNQSARELRIVDRRQHPPRRRQRAAPLPRSGRASARAEERSICRWRPAGAGGGRPHRYRASGNRRSALSDSMASARPGLQMPRSQASMRMRVGFKPDRRVGRIAGRVQIEGEIAEQQPAAVVHQPVEQMAALDRASPILAADARMAAAKPAWLRKAATAAGGATSCRDVGAEHEDRS